MDKNEPKIAKNTYFSKLAAKYMDRIKFSTIDSTKLFSKIKQLVVILLLTTARDSHSAAVETTTGPSSAASPPQKSQSTIKPALALVSGCLLTALFITCLLFFYFRRYPEQQLELDAATGWAGGDRSFLKPAAAHGLDPAVIAAFTTFTYSAVKEIKIDQQVLECAVCLNEFYDHETLRLLPCCHVFHRECIDEWLDLHVTCPVCRANLVPTPGQLSSTTESCFDLNESTEDHVTVDVVDLKHDGSIRKSSRSYSMGHSMGRRRCIENVEKYTLILPDELQNALKNSADDVGEISMKKCVRSASATYVRESSYLGYESFVQEKLRLEDKV